jgi:C-terminal processing protease CtpA/Prc
MLGLFGKLLQGHIITWRFRTASMQPPRTDLEFGGSIYAIVGPGTFSTASDFAHVLEDFHLGTLVGEETGGLRQCFGDCPGFAMPHSGLGFSISTKRWYAPIPKPDDNIHGSLPDIPIVCEQLAPYSSTDDPELAFVLDLVAARTALR